MFCRGVRGATTAEDNSPEEILKATRQLLAVMILAPAMVAGAVVLSVAVIVFNLTTDAFGSENSSPSLRVIYSMGPHKAHQF